MQQVGIPAPRQAGQRVGASVEVGTLRDHPVKRFVRPDEFAAAALGAPGGIRFGAEPDQQAFDAVTHSRPRATSIA